MLYEASYQNDVIVSLTNDEIDRAARHGIEMRRFSVKACHRNHVGYNPDEKKAVRIQALGAVAEAAARKALGLPMDLPAQIYQQADLPHRIEVRLIGMEHYGLRCYPYDDDDKRLLGVVIPPGKERKPYRIPGWYPAGRAKRNDAWKMAPNGRPAMWCVPQSELLPISELLADIHWEEA